MKCSPLIINTPVGTWSRQQDGQTDGQTKSDAYDLTMQTAQVGTKRRVLINSNYRPRNIVMQGDNVHGSVRQCVCHYKSNVFVCGSVNRGRMWIIAWLWSTHRPSIKLYLMSTQTLTVPLNGWFLLG